MWTTHFTNSKHPHFEFNVDHISSLQPTQFFCLQEGGVSQYVPHGHFEIQIKVYCAHAMKSIKSLSIVYVLYGTIIVTSVHHIKPLDMIHIQRKNRFKCIGIPFIVTWFSSKQDVTCQYNHTSVGERSVISYIGLK